MIRLVRVYDEEPGDDADGRPRILVERLWPRGVRREDLRLSEWCKDVAPSDELRRWFDHDPEKWAEFRRRYGAELDAHPDVWEPLRDLAAGDGVTLLYSSRDTEHNNAVALRDYLMARVEDAAN